MWLLPAIVIGLFIHAATADAKGVEKNYFQGNPITQEVAAEKLARGAKDVYSCERVGLKVTAKVIKIKTPKK